jgi:hypothetical protein
MYDQLTATLNATWQTPYVAAATIHGLNLSLICGVFSWLPCWTRQNIKMNKTIFIVTTLPVNEAIRENTPFVPGSLLMRNLWQSARALEQQIF